MLTILGAVTFPAPGNEAASVLAQVVDGISCRQRRDLIRGGPRIPLLRQGLDPPRLPVGDVFQFRAVALHVVELPWLSTQRGQLVTSLADRPGTFVLEIQR